MKVHHHEGLGEEHPKSHPIQLMVAIIFFLIWILDSFIFEFSTIWAKNIPFVLRLIFFGLLVGVGCWLIFRGGHLLFHKAESASRLITTGLFAHMRHPLYLGVLLVYIGLILLTISLLSVIGWLIAFIFYDRLATFEEQKLMEKFKEEYVAYKKKVPKWILRI